MITRFVDRLKARPRAFNLGAPSVWRKFPAACACAATLAACCQPVPTARAGVSLPTPLEAGGFKTLPSSAEISRFLRSLAAESPEAKLVEIGKSAGGRPFEALLISRDTGFPQHGRTDSAKLVVLLLGSQHGAEPSGAEALQRVARDLLTGDLRNHLQSMDLVLIVNANPDGRDLEKRVNASGCNLSTDYARLSQPESRAVAGCLRHYAPHVLLDVHESALLKKSTLGAQGYLTDFEAQFEAVNNPNVPGALRRFAQGKLLPDLVERVEKHGLRCGHYLGEITDVKQIITHGGFTIRNIRNYAGMWGIVPMLLENRLDPAGTYPTPRNIAQRVDKQVLCIRAFLDACGGLRNDILAVAGGPRSKPASEAPPDAVALDPIYAPDPAKAVITVPLRRRDTGALVDMTFKYHRLVCPGELRVSPADTFVTKHQAAIAEILSAHGIPFSKIQVPTKLPAVVLRLSKVTRTTDPKGRPLTAVRLAERNAELHLKPGDLRIAAAPPHAAIVPLLLDPRSSSSIFLSPDLQDLLREGEDFFIARSR